MKKLILWLALFFVSLSVFAAEKTHSLQQQRPTAWNDIKHIVIIVLENQPASAALNQPYMKSLLTKGAYLSNFFAITHPSQPNYFALVAGNTFVSNNNTVTLDVTHIGNLLDAKGKTWKTYAEDYPGNCFLGTTNGPYARRHEPFISFRNIQSSPAQCSKVVQASDFFRDAAANNLPAYSLYIPNNNNNGHDTGIAFADNWLKNTFGNLLNSPTLLKDTLFIITFDEDDGSQNNKVYTVFVGAGAKVAANSSGRYSLYTLLRTVEEIFELGTLGRNDATEQPIMDIWSSSQPPTGECLPPTDIRTSYTPDRKSITINWAKPNSQNLIDYQVNDYLDAPMWRGTQLTFTDASLPGRTGKFTYFLYSNCTTGRSNRVQVDVNITDTPTSECVPPANIQATYTSDRKSITLTWTRPENSLPIVGYQVNDWLNALMWRGTQLSFTDRTLPGRTGMFTYFLYTNCSDRMSKGIRKDVVIS